MATHSAPPDLDVVEDAIRGIAPLLEGYVERYLRLAAVRVAKDPPTEELSLRARLTPDDPVHYVRMLASARGLVPPGSQAEGLWLAARVLIATRRYCLSLDPLAAELREVARAGGDPNDPATRNAIERRLRKVRPTSDDFVEQKFLADLERLDGTSFAAQQATIDKLRDVSPNPEWVCPPEVRDREIVMAEIRALLPDMLAAARRAFAINELTEFPRTRREWIATVSRLGAELKRLGFAHRQVAGIFDGNGADSKRPGVARGARERARQRTRRQRCATASLRK